MSGVYVSYPFCAQKCTYCNFASGVFPRDLELRYIEALLQELRSTEWPWTADTVYLGGGTPSQMNPADLDQVFGPNSGISLARGYSGGRARLFIAGNGGLVEALGNKSCQSRSSIFRAARTCPHRPETYRRGRRA